MAGKCLIVVFALFIYTTVCTGNAGSIVGKPYAQRYFYLDSVFYSNKILHLDTLALFHELDALKKQAVRQGDRELLLELDLIRYAAYLRGPQKNLQLAEAGLLQTIKEAEKLKSRQIELRARQFLGWAYINQTLNYHNALNQYLRSYHLLRELSAVDFPNKKVHIYNVASAYYQFAAYYRARTLLKEAQREPNEHFTARQQINLLNTIGMTYIQELKYDSAGYYFMLGHDLARSTDDSLWMGITGGNRGLIYYRQGRYAEAIPLLKQDAATSLAHHEIDNGLTSLIRLADIRLKQGQTDSAGYALDEVRSYIGQASDPFNIYQYLYPVLSVYYKKRGDLNRALYYADSSGIINDSLKMRKDAMRLAQVQHELDMDAHTRSQSDRERADRLLRNGVIGLIVVAAVTLIWYLYKSRSRFIGQRNAFLKEKELISNDRERVRKDLDLAQTQ
ncbi:MAG: hypothetical protein EOP49_31505, partial [Sphingobacteriales bacterium]